MQLESALQERLSTHVETLKVYPWRQALHVEVLLIEAHGYGRLDTHRLFTKLYPNWHALQFDALVQVWHPTGHDLHEPDVS